jgi:glycosyltransferase involved in cell wall biosynthesis
MTATAAGLMVRQLQTTRIAICHRAVVISDAIGHDIMGMYTLLSDMGFDVAVIGEVFDETVSASMNIVPLSVASPTAFELIIYHHSINWAKGEEFLRSSRALVIFRYHSVTPPAFLQPYSPAYAEECEEGTQQTARLIQRFRQTAYWIADSHFNRGELLACGADPARVSVVPPFNLVADYLAAGSSQGVTQVKVLFIGRFVPQKAHRDAIQIVYSYLRNLDDAIVLRFVGTVDEHFRGYFDELQTLVEALGIRDHIQITGAVPHSELIRLLRESTVFLCCSRHEGFCVPVIEAQAAGLPVVSVNAGALSETLGPGQIACEPPQSTGDYLFYAYVLREIARNSELRKMLITVGHRNVMTRFSPEIIQNQFITNLIPALKALQ